MHQYWYVDSNRNGELYNNQIAIPPLYSQSQIPKLGGINGLGISEDWSCRVYPPGWDPSAGHAGFNYPAQPFPWAQPFHHGGMFPQGHPSTLPPANPFSYNANGQPMNWGAFGNHAGWGGQVNPMGWGGPGPWAPMGWGNNGGNGQMGMLGNLLTMGKGTMNGIGMLSNLIGMGKFLF